MVTLKCSPKVDMVRRRRVVRRRRGGGAQSSMSLFENANRTQQRRIGSCWPVQGDGGPRQQKFLPSSQPSQLTPSSGASMTRPVPPGKFPSTNQAQLQCPATRYRHSGLLGSSVRSAHANAGDKDQPERPVTSGPTAPVHLGPAAAALKLPRNEQGPAPSCKCNSSVLLLCRGPINDSRYFTSPYTHALFYLRQTGLRV